MRHASRSSKLFSNPRFALAALMLSGIVTSGCARDALPGPSIHMPQPNNPPADAECIPKSKILTCGTSMSITLKSQKASYDSCENTPFDRPPKDSFDLGVIRIESVDSNIATDSFGTSSYLVGSVRMNLFAQCDQPMMWSTDCFGTNVTQSGNLYFFNPGSNWNLLPDFTNGLSLKLAELDMTPGKESVSYLFETAPCDGAASTKYCELISTYVGPKGFDTPPSFDNFKIIAKNPDGFDIKNKDTGEVSSTSGKQSKDNLDYYTFNKYLIIVDNRFVVNGYRNVYVLYNCLTDQ